MKVHHLHNDVDDQPESIENSEADGVELNTIQTLVEDIISFEWVLVNENIKYKIIEEGLKAMRQTRLFPIA